MLVPKWATEVKLIHAVFTCLKSTMEIPEQYVKSAQS